MSRFTTTGDIDRIAGMEDPALRNYLITESYHRLSALISERTGPGANWCTFATWASRQAGQTIRQEDLLQAMKERIHLESPFRDALAELSDSVIMRGIDLGDNILGEHIWNILNPRLAMERAGEAVGRGNRKVYAEIGHEFGRFLESFAPGEEHNSEKLTAFLSGLREGEPPEGQRYLKQAFSRYYEAFFEKDPKAKAELLLLANIEIGFHEQTRLQPEIAAALEAAVPELATVRENLLAVLLPDRGWFDRLLGFFKNLFSTPSPLDQALEKVLTHVRHSIRLFLTDKMMELGFPEEILRLGRDIRADFPEHLKTIALPDLSELLSRVDPTRDSLAETGAMDWANLQDRLHFIADLFRCYQEETALMGEPFEAEFVRELEGNLLDR